MPSTLYPKPSTLNPEPQISAVKTVIGEHEIRNPEIETTSPPVRSLFRLSTHYARLEWFGSALLSQKFGPVFSGGKHCAFTSNFEGQVSLKWRVAKHVPTQAHCRGPGLAGGSGA